MIPCAELRIERTDDEQSDQGAWHVDDGVQVVFFPDVIEAAYYIGTLDGLGMARERAAGVPALDDDTRREVPEVLLTFAKWADWYLEDGCRRDHHGYCQAHGLDKDCPVGPMREWLAAYLGGTDGR